MNIPTEQRKIELRTAFKGEYLHIKCLNPFAEYTEKEKSGKGYGKIILADIAAHYGGNFAAKTDNGTHTAVISILSNM